MSHRIASIICEAKLGAQVPAGTTLTRSRTRLVYWTRARSPTAPGQSLATLCPRKPGTHLVACGEACAADDNPRRVRATQHLTFVKVLFVALCAPEMVWCTFSYSKGIGNAVMYLTWFLNSGARPQEAACVATGSVRGLG